MEKIKNTIEQSEKHRPKVDFYIDADKEVDVALWFLQDKKAPHSPHESFKVWSLPSVIMKIQNFGNLRKI